jgi:putative ABC transport system ATP-binding protein
MSAPLVRLDDVYKAYRTSEIETYALAGVSLSIEQSRFTAVTGPSGCGKSTLLNVLGLLDYPDRGRVEVMGREVGRAGEARLTAARRGMVGFIFQNFNLIEQMTIAQNVEMPLTYMGAARRERRERAASVLNDVGLSHRAAHRPSQLSGGQQQRAAIARALVSQPKLILADEPTGNLDSENSRMVIDMLQTLTLLGTAVVMVTHAPELACQAQRRISMRDGRIVDESLAA